MRDGSYRGSVNHGFCWALHLHLPGVPPGLWAINGRQLDSDCSGSHKIHPGSCGFHVCCFRDCDPG